MESIFLERIYKDNKPSEEIVKSISNQALALKKDGIEVYILDKYPEEYNNLGLIKLEKAENKAYWSVGQNEIAYKVL